MGSESRQQDEYGEYAEAAASGRRRAKVIWGMRAFGPIAAIGALMAIWWMTEAIPLSVTSLLPIVLITGFCYVLGGFALGLQF
jgi:solute carrier family 13 (sodium-dependent dicarboxylate transporter), member 2/3/5